MPRSVLILILALTAVERCVVLDSAPAPKPGPPPFVAHSATLDVTAGIKVSDQRPDAARVRADSLATADLDAGSEEIGVVGTQAGHTIMYGLGGAAWRTGRILAAETGPAAAEEGTIADHRGEPQRLDAGDGDGRDARRIDVDLIIRDLISTGPGNVIESFNGRYDSISMSWLNDATIALALRQHPEPLG